jgi:hypothetical protein
MDRRRRSSSVMKKLQHKEKKRLVPSFDPQK